MYILFIYYICESPLLSGLSLVFCPLNTAFYHVFCPSKTQKTTNLSLFHTHFHLKSHVAIANFEPLNEPLNEPLTTKTP
nr:MAG TPA_asm: hypothetical protein [Caudoviricetes sp.]